MEDNGRGMGNDVFSFNSITVRPRSIEREALFTSILELNFHWTSKNFKSTRQWDEQKPETWHNLIIYQRTF